MDKKDHMEILKSSRPTMIKAVDSFYIHPANKLLLHHRSVLSKISWHVTVTDLGKTWISENLDNIVSKYVRQWIERPIQDYIYKNTKQVLKSIRTELTDRLQTGMLSKVFIISFLVANTLKYINSLWSRDQSKLPANIFNLTIKYLNNTLATKKNL